MIVAALIGMAIERFAYRPVRKYARMTTLITAIGVSLLLENLGVVIFGGAPRSFPELLQNETYTLFGNAAISKSQLLIFGVSVALMLLLQWIVYRTKVGTAMRAVSFNLNSAKLMGINTDFIIVFTFALGSALAAAGGVLTAQYNPTIYPLMGIITGLKAFVAAVLGGIGNIPGAVLGRPADRRGGDLRRRLRPVRRHPLDLPRRRRLRHPDSGPALPPGGPARHDRAGKSLRA